MKTKQEPNAMDINKSIQRCLAKVIGIATGLGMSLYVGEDLPEDQCVEIKKQASKKISNALDVKQVNKIAKSYREKYPECFDGNEAFDKFVDNRIKEIESSKNNEEGDW